MYKIVQVGHLPTPDRYGYIIGFPILVVCCDKVLEAGAYIYRWGRRNPSAITI
jgi:hypothetical protein